MGCRQCASDRDGGRGFSCERFVVRGRQRLMTVAHDHWASLEDRRRRLAVGASLGRPRIGDGLCEHTRQNLIDRAGSDVAVQTAARPVVPGLNIVCADLRNATVQVVSEADPAATPFDHVVTVIGSGKEKVRALLPTNPNLADLTGAAIIDETYVGF